MVVCTTSRKQAKDQIHCCLKPGPKSNSESVQNQTNFFFRKLVQTVYKTSLKPGSQDQICNQSTTHSGTIPKQL